MITNGTDVPVERIDPIASYYSSVTRRMINGDEFYPEHIMTRKEAMETYTINKSIPEASSIVLKKSEGVGRLNFYRLEHDGYLSSKN